MALNREQKGALATEVIRQVGNLVEFWGEREEVLSDENPLKGVALSEVRAQLSAWMNRLPGNGWDVRLDEVN